MDRLHALFALLKENKQAKANFLGVLNVLIGRRIEDGQGALVSAGLTWRETAVWLKRVRWGREAVHGLGLDPATLPPRDRERYWYAVISQAQVGSPKAAQAGDRLARVLTTAGYRVGPAPANE
jgi:hypothetical protein